MDSIRELLLSWEVTEVVINNFEENGISIELLPKLNPDTLKELCPHLATRIILQEKIAELITAQAPTESNNSDIILNLDDIQISSILTPSTHELSSENHGEQSSEPFSPRRDFPQFDLHTLLQTSAGGNSILKYYETYGVLENSKRNQLTDIIVKHLYTYIVNSRITYEEYNLVAAKIITLFPKESMGTYFTKPIRKSNSIHGRSTVARGKLVDKVRNLLYKYGDRKRQQSSDPENTHPSKRQNIEDLQDTYSRDIIWLNSNSEPWDEVIQKWKVTFTLRKEGEHKSVHEFLQNWKILSDPRSDTLINIDFDLLHPDKGLNFYVNWNTFFEKLILLKSTKDEGLLNLMESLQNIDEELKLPGQLKILAHLVPPRGRISKKVKFTTQEAIESIYICVPNIGDVEQVINEQKQKALSKKLCVQPYIIIQGSLVACTSLLLIVDDVRYQFQSVKKAFDTLFKLYHTFNARYPKAGDHLYLIIQRCVYKIETKYDNVVSYINDILNL